MTMYRPDQLRDALSDLIEDQTPLDEYIQNAATDTAWRASQEPMAPDLQPEDVAGLRHMLFHVEIREVGIETRIGNDTRLRAVIDAYCLSAIRPRGDHAAVKSWGQALAMTRHMWFTLADSDRHIGGITSIVEQGETSYRVIPLTVEWLMGHVRIPILFTDTMEA